MLPKTHLYKVDEVQQKQFSHVPMRVFVRKDDDDKQQEKKYKNMQSKHIQ